MSKKKYVCPRCDSGNITIISTLEWDCEKQEWIIHEIFPDGWCDRCSNGFDYVKEILMEE